MDTEIEQEFELPYEPDGPWAVNALWLLDLEEYNEWMCEEDYLVDEDSVCINSISSINFFTGIAKIINAKFSGCVIPV